MILLIAMLLVRWIMSRQLYRVNEHKAGEPHSVEPEERDVADEHGLILWSVMTNWDRNRKRGTSGVEDDQAASYDEQMKKKQLQWIRGWGRVTGSEEAQSATRKCLLSNSDATVDKFSPVHRIGKNRVNGQMQALYWIYCSAEIATIRQYKR